MDHDITHCKNNKCKVHETCNRWIAYQEVLNGKYEYPVSISLQDCKDKCNLYWKNTKKSN